MGCDIHLYVERRENGKWVSADKWTTDKDDDTPRVEQRFYNVRNYDLFAILANVRNGRGFAGVSTGEGFNPIAEPRGVPEDASPEYAEEVKRWDSDGHSHSWFTLAELLAYDWTQETVLSGTMNAETFAKWDAWARKQGESPDEWCGAIAGPKIVHINESEMRNKIKELVGDRHAWHCLEEIKKELGNHFVRCQWPQKYYQCCKKFWWETIPRLLRIGAQEDVRIVFFFDN